jgi:hypothetical protein
LFCFVFFLFPEGRLQILLNQLTFEVSVPLTVFFFFFLRADLLNQFTRCLTKTVKPKKRVALSGVCHRDVGISPRLTEQGSPLMFKTKEERVFHPELLGKGEGEAEG